MLAAGLAPMLPDILRHGEEDAKEGAIWCVINLTASGEGFPGAAKRVAALREAGAFAVPLACPCVLPVPVRLGPGGQIGSAAC